MRMGNQGKLNRLRMEGVKQGERFKIGLDRVDNTSDLEKPVPIKVTQLVTPIANKVRMVVPVHADSAANIVLTNQASAEDFLATSSRNQWLIDLTGFTQVRMTALVLVASASANTPKIVLRYYVAYSGSAADYSSDIAQSEVACSLAATGLIVSSWTSLKVGVSGDTYIAIIQKGGDGAADPEIGSVTLQFR